MNENLDEYESKIKGLAQLKVVKDLFQENFIFSNWIFRFGLEIHLKAPGCLGHQEICCVVPVHNMIWFCTCGKVCGTYGAYKCLEVHGTYDAYKYWKFVVLMVLINIWILSKQNVWGSGSLQHFNSFVYLGLSSGRILHCLFVCFMSCMRCVYCPVMWCDVRLF